MEDPEENENQEGEEEEEKEFRSDEGSIPNSLPLLCSYCGTIVLRENRALKKQLPV